VSWKSIELAKVCEVFADGDWIESKDQSDIGIRLIQTGNVGFGRFKARDSKARYINEETFKRLRCTEIKAGDLLISRLPDPVGRACIIPQLVEKSITAVDCTIIRTKQEILDSDYLNYYCQSAQYFEQVKKNITGATRQRISRSLLGKTLIPLAPIATQQEIVAKLDAIFAEIDTAKVAAEANANNAEALFQSFLDNLFLNIAKTNNPIKLSGFIKLEYGKGLEDNDRDLNGIYGAYGANGVKSKTNKFLYDKPSIVVGRKGSAGELTLVEEKFWALDVTYYVTHDTKKTDLNFLYYALKMLKIPSLAKGIKPGINRNDVYDLSIAVPILSEQKVLVEKILYVKKNLDIAKNLYKTKVSELNFLKQSILQQAFNGELVKD